MVQRAGTGASRRCLDPQSAIYFRYSDEAPARKWAWALNVTLNYRGVANNENINMPYGTGENRICL